MTPTGSWWTTGKPLVCRPNSGLAKKVTAKSILNGGFKPGSNRDRYTHTQERGEMKPHHLSGDGNERQGADPRDPPRSGHCFAGSREPAAGWDIVRRSHSGVPCSGAGYYPRPAA